MMQKKSAGVLTLAFTVAVCGDLAAQDPVQSCDADPFIGTWVIDSKNGDKVPTSKDGRREILVLNGGHFFYGQLNDETKTIARISKGGVYRIVNGRYTETIEFAANARAVGQSHTFTVSIREGSLVKSGQLRSKRLDQVWKRFAPAVSDARSSSEWKEIPVAGLEEWSDPAEWWSSRDGVVVAESPGGRSKPKIHHLFWDGTLTGDFELRVEYRITSTSPQDAGIYFRVHRNRGVNKRNNLIGYQAELDTANLYSTNDTQRNGKLFGNIFDGKRHKMLWRGKRLVFEANGQEKATPLAEPFDAPQVFRRPPAWNECLIRTQGDLIQLHLNGRLANEVVDHHPRRKSTGDAIALQFRPNGAYRFEVRNLMFRTAGD